MNVLSGRITEIEEEGKISLVTIDFNGLKLHSLIIENVQSADYLKIGKTVDVWFKETELIVNPEPINTLSCPNQFKVKIEKIAKGKVLSKIKAFAHGNEINAIIPTRGLEKYDYREGNIVCFLLKSNEIVISA